MKDNEKRGSSFANFLLVGAALTGTFAVAAPAVAQDAGDETIVVTGSRIARPGLVSTTPVAVLGEERLEQQGYENIADVLLTLPQFAPSFGASRTQSTFSGATSSGLNVTNLRNLSSARSLTLINGRRAPSGVITSSGVDLNTIPSANIERIEVITGGASAIYGADAVAGVVNIITDRDFEGVEIGYSYGEAFENADNQNPSGFIRFGGALGDRGHATLTAQYEFQGFVSCRDRYLCAQDFAWTPTAGAPNASSQIRGPAAYSGVVPQGRWLIDAGNALTAQDLNYRNGALVPFAVATDGYNRNPRRALAIPTERLMIAADANYELWDGVSAFAEINYGSSETDAPFEGHPFQSTTDTVGSISTALGGLEATIPIDNPFIPADLRAAMVARSDTALSWLQRFDSLGVRGAQNVRQTVRLATGLEGELETLGGLGSNWNWEVSYVFGRTTLDSITNGLVSRANLYTGLRVEEVPGAPGTYRCVDPLARASGCVPINPFAPYTQAQINYLTVNAGTRGETELENGLAFISGDLLELPAGPLQIGFGVESRRTTAFQDYDDPINRGLTTGNRIGDNAETTFRTQEAYVEAVVPILSDAPLAYELNLEGAYRVSDSSNFGTYDTWKYGGDWSPVPGVRLRAMQARAVRAPVLGDVSGISQTAGVVNDPCTNERIGANGTRTANCNAEGIPNNYNPVLIIRQGVQGFVVGNANLTPEIADTTTYGFVIQAGQFDGIPAPFDTFTLTVDRFQIEIADVITTTGRQTIADLCYDLTGAARAPYCSLVQRGFSPITGVNYTLLTVNDTVDNLAAYNISGYDVEASMAFDLGGAGSLNLSTSWTFYDEAELRVGVSRVDLLGFAGGSTSDQGYLEQQGTFTTAYSIGDLAATLTTRYIPETAQSPFQNAFTPDLPAAWYNDINVRYNLTPTATVYGGINNLTDEEPPFMATGTSGTQALDTIPAYYDVFGRSWYAGVKVRF